MITAIVRFELKAGTTLNAAAKLFEGSAPLYRQQAGLIRKYYLYDGKHGGGVYLWESRAAAERFHGPEWRKIIADRYGAEPQVSYFETPVIVDNESDEVIVA